MTNDAKCLKCGAPLNADARDGVCPKCLLGQALAGTGADASTMHTSSVAPCQRCHAPTPTADLVNGFCSACVVRVIHEMKDLAAPPPPLAGTTVRYFGDYELLEEIAHGGMGVVWRARQRSLNRIVALKLIRAGALANEAEVRRFHTEAEAAAQLQHPNIVAVHEVGAHAGQQFFSMDYVAGPSLETRVRENPLAPRKAATYLKKIAEAIHYAHDQGVLHRDLKPGNVLVDPNDEPRVTDFGLAKLLHSDSGQTLSGTVMGSLSYMPPEQAEGRVHDLDARSDVYSLGATLYELITGRPPFRAETAAQTLKLISETDPVPPRLMNPRLPLDLETICLKCLAKERNRRYQTAQELGDELGRFLAGEPIRARPVSAPEKVWRWCRRKPVVAGLAAASVVLLITVAVGSTIAAIRIAVARHAEQHERQRAQAALTRLEIERAESLFAADSSGRGLAYLARLLRQQPTNAVVAERLMSALSHRSFCLPTAQPLRHGKPMNSPAYPKSDGESALPAFIRLGGSIRAANFSPDGQRVLTASRDGTARVWDSRTGLPVGEPLHHEAEVMWAQFSTDGRQVGTASLDKTARVWDTQTGQAKTPPLRHDNGVLYVAFSPDGRKVVTASLDKTVRLWDSETGQVLLPSIAHGAAVYFASFNADGSRLLTASADRLACIHNSDTGQKIASLSHTMPFDNLLPFPHLSSDEKRLAAASGNAAAIWDLATRKPAAAPLNHGNAVCSVRFSPDGKVVATASIDNTARLWDATTGLPVTPPIRHEHWVVSAQFDPAGQRLVTTSRDNTARIWDALTGRPLTEPLRHDSCVRSAQFSPDGQRLVTISDGDSAWLWDTRLAQSLTAPMRDEGDVRRAVFSPDGRRVVTASWSGTVRVWDARSSLPVTGAMKLAERLEDIRFSPDGLRLATASDRDAQVWDAATGKPITGPLRHSHYKVNCVRFSADGQRLATASHDETARVWSASTGQMLAEFRHASGLMCAQFSPDGQWLATASNDGTARIWDSHTGRALTEPLSHEDSVHWVEFSPDGQRVATISKDKTVRIWDARSGRMLLKPLTHADEPYHYYSVHFSPDGTRVAAAAGSTVQIWDARTGEPLLPPLRHEGRVNSVRFSPDGQRLVTASYDDTARIWDVATGHLLREPLRHGARVQYAEFSPDGRSVVTASTDGTAQIWEIALAPVPIPDWLPELAEAVAGQRIDARDISIPVPVEELFRLKQRLGESAGDDYYVAWAKWFFAEDATRPLSPGHPLRRLAASTNGLDLADVAQRLATVSNDIPHALDLADSFSAKAAVLAPNEPEVVEARAQVLERRGDSTAALATLDQAVERIPTSLALWSARGRLLRQVNRTNEALAAYSKAIALAGATNTFISILAEVRGSRSSLLKEMNRLDEAAADHLVVLGIPPRNPRARPEQLDLSLFYNYEVTAILGMAAGSPAALSFAEDVRQKTGVSFDLRGLVALGGKTGDTHFPLVEKQPTLLSFAGIPVNRRFARLHVLHGTSKEVRDGTVIGTYVLRYADGRKAELPFAYGTDLRNWWWWTDDKPTPGAELAWTGMKEAPSHKGPVRLYKMTRQNPHPEVEVRSLDFVSTRTACAPFLVAVTVEP